jgi:hypothetical protein
MIARSAEAVTDGLTMIWGADTRDAQQVRTFSSVDMALTPAMRCARRLGVPLLSSVQQHQMPTILGCFDFFDGQCDGTLPAGPPDDVDRPPADALDQARPYRDVLFSTTARQVGDWPGDASAVCRDVHDLLPWVGTW